ncbi:high mobility group protein 1.2-like isoform X2 [Cyanistes caeruleus]|uniref:high mobility group protein 1.2-like isoform X1 n=1 Tax=Cyanistes caeruleus TaxID=156563 RepID=UPI000CDA4301|nr:high mobility group protein 1.2-like isoform X1 [Cyanistes caeruleus]XP_023797042.1 high mobility group protein 1.2-like isoform X2 [Cyanistes caeruleus]
MARPVRSRRGPSTTMLFRITIQRPRHMLRRPMRARSRLRARRGRRFGKSVRFRSRRALPPFFLFMERHRRRLQRTYPNLTMVQTAKRLGRMWQRLPEEDKEMYKEEAERMKGMRVRRRLRSWSRPMMSSRRRAMKNLMISFTTKAANLRNFLLSYL